MPREHTTTWALHIGIHRGTITSRDSELPKPMESLNQCKEEGMKAVADYRSLGCKVWYCYAISPEGERHTIVQGEDYA